MFAIRHLKVWQKFALVGALALAVLAPISALQVKTKYDGLRTTQTEREALQAVKDLSALIRLTQQHRGLTAGSLGGDAKASAARETKSAEVSKALAEVNRTAAAYDAEGADAGLPAIRRDWDALGRDVGARSLAAADSFKRHTALIGSQMRLLVTVADRSGLILDSDPALYHLIAASVESLPMITEVLGQSRAIGSNILGRGEASRTERATLASALSSVEQHQWAVARHLRAARDADATTDAPLASVRQAAATAAEQAVKLVNEKIVNNEALSEPAMAYFAAMTGHIDAQFKLGDAMLSLLRESLDARVAADRWALVAVLGLVAGSILGIAATITAIARSTSRNVAAALAATSALARGDLVARVDTDARDEIGDVARSVGEAMTALAQIVAQIRSAGESVGTASAQIASGNSDLSARTESTASSLQQAAASMDELTATVRSSAETAHQANALATRAADIAVQGGEMIGRVVAAMEEIAASSRKINDIIGVIDGIAFQTNILALNAAVEAARAGDQGRGFAVVASEVRSLAQRSADAAKQIKTLIGTSSATVEAGTAHVADAGRTITSIVEQAGKVRELIADLGRATDEESSGISQVNTAVSQLDQATQQNAALVEESAAAAESLNTQAQRLVQTIARFRVAAA